MQFLFQLIEIKLALNQFNNIFFQMPMQIQIPQKNQDQRHPEGQAAIEPTKQIWRNKISNHIYPMISIDHICNIQDSFFINQKSFRDPQHQEQSFLKTIFYFKSVAKVSVSEYFVTLHLKKRDENYLPKQYFIERFKSFGSKQFYDIAIHLQHISEHLAEIKNMSTQSIKQNYSKENQQKILEDSLKKLQKKKFFSFFYQFTGQGSCLNQIIISKALLLALGYDYEDIAIDFLKYQQAIFEIISAKLYCLVMEKKSQLLDEVFQQMKDHIMSPQQVKQLTMFRFNDDLLPKSNSNDTDYERKIRSRIKFSKTHPSVTIFEIQKMNKKGKMCYEPKNKLEEQKLAGYKKAIKNQQYECIKHLLKVSDNCLQENKQKMSSYRVIRPQLLRSKKRTLQSSSDSEYLGFD